MRDMLDCVLYITSIKCSVLKYQDKPLSSVFEQKCRYGIIYHVEPMKEVLSGLFFVMEEDVTLS